MKVKEIGIGRRHRQHIGDLRSLAASIGKVGLLDPIVVDGDGRLVAGARRIAAVRSLGWRDVPVRVVRNLSDAANALRAERDENTERQEFRPSEACPTRVRGARQRGGENRMNCYGAMGLRCDYHGINSGTER